MNAHPELLFRFEGVAQAIGQQFIDQQSEWLGLFDGQVYLIAGEFPMNRIFLLEQGILHVLYIFAYEVVEQDSPCVRIEIEVLVDEGNRFDPRTACAQCLARGGFCLPGSLQVCLLYTSDAADE